MNTHQIEALPAEIEAERLEYYAATLTAFCRLTTTLAALVGALGVVLYLVIRLSRY